MDWKTNQKSGIIPPLFPTANGRYFWMFFFIFTACTVIESLSPHNLSGATLIAGVILFLGIIIRSKFLTTLCLLPFFIYFLLSLQISKSQNSFQEISRIQSEHGKISGVVKKISGVKNGLITIETSLDGNNAQIKIPPQRNLLLGTHFEANLKKISPADYSQIARGIDAVGEADEVVLLPNKIHPFYQIKNTLLAVIVGIYPFPEHALLAGILLGDASLMDDTFSAVYRTIGLSHITVVSGSNISFLLSGILLLLFFIPKKWRITLAILSIVVYICLVGTDVPVLRAGIMGIIAAISLGNNAKLNSLQLLSLTGIFLIIFSPVSLVYDKGFQLSFLATLGILIANNLFPKAGALRQSIIISVFAAIWTMPVTLGTFGNFHSWSIVANILVGPIIGISMTLSILGLVFHVLSESLSLWFSHLAFYGLTLIQTIAETLAPLPFYTTLDESKKIIVGFITFGIITGLSLRYRCPQKPSDGPPSLSLKV